LLRVLAIGSAVPFLVIGAPVRADQGAIPVLRMMTNITELEVVNAQKLWCGSLLNIDQAHCRQCWCGPVGSSGLQGIAALGAAGSSWVVDLESGQEVVDCCSYSLKAQWLHRYQRCRSFAQIRSSDLRNSPPLFGLAKSRLQKTLLIHQSCRPPKARATRPNWMYPQFRFSITPSADSPPKSATVPA